MNNFEIETDLSLKSKDGNFFIKKDQDSNRFMLLNKEGNLIVNGTKEFCIAWYETKILKV